MDPWINKSTRRVALQVVQPSRSTALGRVVLTQTLQWRARQDVGVVDALPYAGWRRWSAVASVKGGDDVVSAPT